MMANATILAKCYEVESMAKARFNLTTTTTEWSIKLVTSH